MKKRWLRRLIISVVAALCLALAPFGIATATNPTVTMTVTAGVVSMTNSEDTWALGYATISEVIYFSATGAEDDNYSTVNNTGNTAIDVEIQGVDFDGGDYDWTLGASSGNQTYSLYANSGNGTSTYNIQVQSSNYTKLVTDLGAGEDYVWSMKFTAPNEFHASEDMAEKSATVTLVATEHT